MSGDTTADRAARARETARTRVARWRQQRRDAGIARTRTAAEKTANKTRAKAFKRANPRSNRPFVGCDGEGAGKDELGRQNYLLFRMGDAELWRDGAPLTTAEIFDFICKQPRHRNYVGFAFGYDTTMILRDICDEPMKPDRDTGKMRNPYLARMFLSDVDRDRLGLKSGYVHWKGFAVHYLPGQFLRVARIDRETQQRDKTSVRTIYETFGFFQESFCKEVPDPEGAPGAMKQVGALAKWDIGTPEERAAIAAGKARRGGATLDPDDRTYCAMECRLLADLMTKFRAICHGNDDSEFRLRPKKWNGAGKLAAYMHTANKTPRLYERAPEAWQKKYDAGEKTPAPLIVVEPAVQWMAGAAYYGGRFEVMRVGRICEAVHEYDIVSAYPAAMLAMPCLVHGVWHEFTGDDTQGADIFVASVAYKHPKSVPFCGLPHRTSERRLSWRRQGNGTYWSWEIRAAVRLGAKVKIKGGWRFEKRCDCVPFAWVRSAFDFRKGLGKGTLGMAIKLAINALYGQLARRIGGGGPWSNAIWAGLITAATRAALMDAARQDPDAIIMFATDGIYSRRPLNLPIGKGLGDWEYEHHAGGMFTVQAGLYWGADKLKTRGVSPSIFAPHMERFEAAWDAFLPLARQYSAAFRRGGDFRKGLPVVAVPLTVQRLDPASGKLVSVPALFQGVRLAHSQGKPQSAGQWLDTPKNISFNWVDKRTLLDWRVEGECIVTRPLDGDPDAVSFYSQAAPDDELLWQQNRQLLDSCGDYMDFSAPGM